MRLLVQHRPLRYLGVALAMGIPAVGVTVGPANAAGPPPIIVIVMENHSYSKIVGNANAPFINKTMIAGGTLDTNYFGVSNSTYDYMLMTSGQTSYPTSASDVFAALGSATPWTEYMESMPSACYTSSHYGLIDGTTTPLYTKYHNPAMLDTLVSKTALCQKVVPLGSSFNPAALPAFSYIVPNQCNDMHTLPTSDQCPMWNGSTNTASNTIKMGDNWLASFVPQVAPYATVIVTWDEGSSTNERVATIAYGAGVTHGSDSTAYTHASLEAGLYSYLGLGVAPGSGATATPLPIP